MKKLIPVMIILICCLLTGCGSPHMPIEDCAWRLQDAVMDSPDRYNQIAVDYDRKGDEPVEGVNYIICTLEAGDGGFTIRDKTNDLMFSGTYKLISSDRNAIVYLIDVGGVIGSAVSSALYYSDGAQTKTLTVSIGGYTLNFHEMK